MKERDFCSGWRIIWEWESQWDSVWWCLWYSSHTCATEIFSYLWVSTITRTAGEWILRKYLSSPSTLNLRFQEPGGGEEGRLEVEGIFYHSIQNNTTHIGVFYIICGSNLAEISKDTIYFSRRSNCLWIFSWFLVVYSVETDHLPPRNVLSRWLVGSSSWRWGWWRTTHTPTPSWAPRPAGCWRDCLPACLSSSSSTWWRSLSLSGNNFQVVKKLNEKKTFGITFCLFRFCKCYIFLLSFEILLSATTTIL